MATADELMAWPICRSGQGYFIMGEGIPMVFARPTPYKANPIGRWMWPTCTTCGQLLEAMQEIGPAAGNWCYSKRCACGEDEILAPFRLTAAMSRELWTHSGWLRPRRLKHSLVELKGAVAEDDEDEEDS